MIHLIVLDTYTPTFICHSTYIMFLIMTLEELKGADISVHRLRTMT